MSERQIIELLKRLKIPFIDPCDDDYEGDCEICPVELVFPEAINICGTEYPMGTTLVQVLDDICGVSVPLINAYNGLTDTHGGTIDITLGGPLTQITEIDGQTFNFNLHNVGTLQLESRNIFKLRTPEVFNATRIAGQVLVLQNADGTVEFDDVPGDNWGEQVVITDATLTGDGTVGSPLSVIPSGGITADNGIYLNGSEVRLGGTLKENTQVIPDTFKLILGQNQLIEWDDVANYLRIAPDTVSELTHVRGAILFKKNAAGSQDHVEYSSYGMPTISPTTFDIDYIYRWAADGTGEWIALDSIMDGLSYTTGIIGSTTSKRLQIGGDLLTSRTLTLDGNYFSIYDSLVSGFMESKFDNSIIPTIYDIIADDLTITNPGTEIAGVTTQQTLVNLKHEIVGSKLSQIEVKEDIIEIQVTGSGNALVEIGDGYVKVTVPEYASDLAADSDVNLPSGSLYRITGTRDVKYKP